MTGYIWTAIVLMHLLWLSPGDRTTSYRIFLQLDWPLRKGMKTKTRHTGEQKGQLAFVCLSEWKETYCH